PATAACMIRATAYCVKIGNDATRNTQHATRGRIMYQWGRGGRGPQFVSRNGSAPAEGPPPPEDKPPETWRTRLQNWAKNVRATTAGVPRAVRLVWKAHRGYTLTMGILSIVYGVVPTATAWISKLLIDAVVGAAQHPGPGPTNAVIGL